MSYQPPYDPRSQQPQGPYPPQQPPQPGVYGQPRQPPPHQPPYGFHQQPPPYPQHGPMPQHTQTVTTGGLPTWMHVLYLTLGWIPCFLGWVIWPIHWWFAKSKSVSVTQTTAVYRPPPPPPPQQWSPPGPH